MTIDTLASCAGCNGWRCDRRGVTSLEYALIAGVVVVAVLFGFNHVGQQLRSQFDVVDQHIDLGQASPNRLTATIIDAGD